jgi:hypothetical protein
VRGQQQYEQSGEKQYSAQNVQYETLRAVRICEDAFVTPLLLRLDLLLSLLATWTIAWVLLALFGALLLGGAVAAVFGSIFFGMSRLAKIAAAQWEGDGTSPSQPTQTLRSEGRFY